VAETGVVLSPKPGHTGLAKNGAGTWDFALNVDLG
jgi:hypothetical protein